MNRKLSKKLILLVLLAGSTIINNVYGEGDLPPLYTAARNYNEKRMNELIEQGEDVNKFITQKEPERNPDGSIKGPLDQNLIIYLGKYPSSFSLLHLAVDRRHTNVVERLVKLGADVDAQDSLGNTPITLALKQNKGDLLHLMIPYTKDLQAVTDWIDWLTNEITKWQKDVDALQSKSQLSEDDKSLLKSYQTYIETQNKKLADARRRKDELTNQPAAAPHESKEEAEILAGEIVAQEEVASQEGTSEEDSGQDIPPQAPALPAAIATTPSQESVTGRKKAKGRKKTSRRKKAKGRRRSGRKKPAQRKRKKAGHRGRKKSIKRKTKRTGRRHPISRRRKVKKARDFDYEESLKTHTDSQSK